MKSRVNVLVIHWSASVVEVFDPISRRISTAKTVAGCLPEGGQGRDCIVAVGRRSAYIRAFKLPSASRSDTTKIVEMKLSQELPAAPSPYVIGYRAVNLPGGQAAVSSAIKQDTMRALTEATSSVGLNVRAVLPIAFGSWLTARARGLKDVAVVTASNDSLSMDIISEGELKHSRSTPLPDSRAGIEDEISRTFAIAGTDRLPVEKVDEESILETLSDPTVISRQLFSFGLSVPSDQQRARKSSWIVARAVIACALALLCVGFTVQRHSTAVSRNAKAQAQRLVDQRRLSEEEGVLRGKASATKQAESLLSTAFQPSQSFGDIVSVLGASMPSKTWLSGLTLQRGRPVVLRGQAETGKELASFVEALGKQPRFRDVKLSSASKALIGKRPIVQFAISGIAVGNLPIDLPVEGQR